MSVTRVHDAPSHATAPSTVRLLGATARESGRAADKGLRVAHHDGTTCATELGGGKAAHLGSLSPAHAPLIAEAIGVGVGVAEVGDRVGVAPKLSDGVADPVGVGVCVGDDVGAGVRVGDTPTLSDDVAVNVRVEDAVGLGDGAAR